MHRGIIAYSYSNFITIYCAIILHKHNYLLISFAHILHGIECMCNSLAQNNVGNDRQRQRWLFPHGKWHDDSSRFPPSILDIKVMENYWRKHWRKLLLMFVVSLSTAIISIFLYFYYQSSGGVVESETLRNLKKLKFEVSRAYEIHFDDFISTSDVYMRP